MSDTPPGDSATLLESDQVVESSVVPETGFRTPNLGETRDFLRQVCDVLQINFASDPSLDREMLVEIHRRLNPYQRAQILELLADHRQVETLQNIVYALPTEGHVALEGTPLYADEPWDERCEFGYNVLLSTLFGILRRMGREVIHIGLYDQYTVNTQPYPQDSLTERSVVDFDSVALESDMAGSAQASLELFQAFGMAQEDRNGHQVLSQKGKPRLQASDETGDGRFSCAILDAAFQREKAADVVMLVHPSEYVRQQDYMRSILVRRAWLEQLQDLRSQMERLVTDYVLGDVEAEQRPETFERIQTQVNQALSSQVKNLNRLEVSRAMRGILGAKHYRIQEQRGRFEGLGNALNEVLETFERQELLPFEMVTIFFNDDHQIDRITRLDRNGSVNSQSLNPA